jgi:hypothetical protein
MTEKNGDLPLESGTGSSVKIELAMKSGRSELLLKLTAVKDNRD